MRVKLSQSIARDEDRLRHFFDRAEHRHVALREPLLRPTIARGHVFIFEVDGDIIGSGAIFIHRIAPGKSVVETGQARIIRNGFNLIRCLSSILLLCAIGDVGDAQFVFGQIDADNTRGQAFARQSGREAFTPDAGLLQAATDALPFEKRAEALGVETIYWRYTQTNYAAAEAYFRAHRQADVIQEQGPAGRVTIQLHPSLSQMIDRHLPTLHNIVSANS